MKVYGIKQCDTCHKALKWLGEHNIAHQFHDLRVDGIDKKMVRGWLASESADFLVNKRSTTWRTLTQDQKDAKGDALITLIVENPTLVKRPVFESDKVIAVGFSPAKLLPVLKAGD